MPVPLLELEGTAEEIQERLNAFSGQRLHISVRPISTHEEAEYPLSISEALLAMADKMPEAERAKMPADLAAQHDHYLYGWDKK